MTLHDNNNPEQKKHLLYGFLFWMALIAIFCFLAFSCRAKKTTVETSKVETKEIVKDSTVKIETSNLVIEKTTPVQTGSFYPYDTTRNDNPIFENEIDNGSTKVKIKSTKKGLSIITESKPVENKTETNFKGITQHHKKEVGSIIEKTWYQKIIAVPIFLKWWFWLLIIIVYLIIRFAIKKYTAIPKKIIDTIENNND